MFNQGNAAGGLLRVQFVLAQFLNVLQVACDGRQGRDSSALVRPFRKKAKGHVAGTNLALAVNTIGHRTPLLVTDYAIVFVCVLVSAGYAVSGY